MIYILGRTYRDCQRYIKNWDFRNGRMRVKVIADDTVEVLGYRFVEGDVIHLLPGVSDESIEVINRKLALAKAPIPVIYGTPEQVFS